MKTLYSNFQSLFIGVKYMKQKYYKNVELIQQYYIYLLN